ncbi:hypothetical protein BXZ70DRAFT_1009398 [Cristinia sonorae]|uniref:Uncharacterized protein n=1 Tax=Cristinia sonorae TaxID=1940300 RepID=A0A8K0UM02_9AGAR|nr:hypothetical protein BXZ70DRAFT_1009398 [Cristinia sonorae]
MLNALTRIFQSTSSGSNPSPTENGQQAQELTPPPPIRPDGETMSRKPSSLLMDRVRRDHPSQVAWISPSSGSFSNRSPSKPAEHSPVPSPSSVMEPTPTRSRLIGTRKPSLTRMSTGSLNLQSVYLSDHSETSSVGSALQNKPLSPIHEQQPYAPTTLRHPSQDSVPRTPDSTGAFSFSSHPFLTRTLKRTSSHASTSTVASGAPSIPPLDLRPQFSSPLSLPPRKSSLAQSSLPTVVGSRRDVSVIYEDSSNLSFMTAASVHGSDSEMDVTDRQADGDDEPRVSQFRETYFNSSIGDSQMSLTEHGDEDEENVLRHSNEDEEEDITPHALQEVDIGFNPPSSTLVDRFSRDATFYLNSRETREIDHVSEHSFETSTTSTAVMESRIQSRWLKGLSFGSVRFQKPSGKESVHAPASTAFVLFWVGFIAPWCWLIGGWYLSRSGEMEPDGQYLTTVPSLMWPRGDDPHTYTDKYHHCADADLELGTKKPVEAKAPATTWRTRLSRFPFWSPHHVNQQYSPKRSKEVLPLSVKHTSDDTHYMHAHSEVFDDPWVMRCRIAAVVSGALFVVGCIVTPIVVSGVKG